MNKKGFIYFTLGEIISLEDDTLEPNSKLHDLTFTTIMTNYGLTIENDSADNQAILNQLMRMIYARFYSCEVYRKELEYPYYQDASAPDSDERKEVFREFIQVFNLTSPRYIPLLQQFNANASDPIGKISSTSTGKTRFNE